MKKESNVIKKIMIIIVAILVAVSGFYTIDYNLAKSNKRPIFAITTATYKDGGTKEYLGIGYKVIKFNTLDGRRDAVFGPWSMNINDLTNPLEAPGYNGKYTNISYDLFRVHNYSEKQFPVIKSITSLIDLKNNLKDFEDTSGTENDFKDILEKYNQQFFDNGGLIFVVLEEGSGSISHKLNSVDQNNNVLTVNIDRFLPDAGTDDMAWWVFLIELDKDILSKAQELRYAISDIR